MSLAFQTLCSKSICHKCCKTLSQQSIIHNWSEHFFHGS
ncbi:hypothetical protein LI162_14490 [Mediterraneibacter sp. 210702-DFI.3.120]|nr:hypothetical protein [Mediterraneibacter faecis]MCB5937587.1 hypothetical protein [Lachnospiraceae bacterium 210521-DFI.3.107]MCB6487929.1 hypothetical protein [Mediterraneibacter sp. 210702-DFI.3.120]MCB5567447.1 hypothetical protein [Mediterraneibacter faecis]MCB5578226.1 hypothetical protein [Mediterraneibacter faecis]